MNDSRDRRIVDYLEGRLEDADLDRFEREMAASPALAWDVKAARRGLEAVREMAAALPNDVPDLRGAVEAAIAAEEDRSTDRPGTQRLGRAARIAAAALLLLGLPLSGWLMRGAVGERVVSVPEDSAGLPVGTERMAGNDGMPAGAGLMAEGTYLLLFRGLWLDDAELSPAQREDRMMEYVSWVRELRADGRLITGNHLSWEPGLQLTATGMGMSESRPDLDPRDILSGFVVIYAENDAEAERIARSCPHTRYGTVIVKRAGE